MLLSLFWGWVVYLYQVRQIKNELFIQLEKVSHSLIPERKVSFNNIESTVFKNFIVISEHQLLDYSFVSLNVYNVEKQAIFQYANPSKDIGIHKDRKNKLNFFPAGDNEELSFFKIEDKVYFHVFKPIYESQKLLGYIDMIVTVGPRIVHQFGRALIIAILHTSGTISMMALVLFPLIHASYRKLRRNSRELLESHLYTIKALGNAIANRDSETGEHNYRVTYFSLCLAEQLHLSSQSIQSLVKGAFLHDIGKIGIRDNILLKPSSLSNDEFTIMKTHVEQGVRIVNDIPWLQDSIDVIRFHHERYDGSGYPLGIAGQQIPIIARVFAVADVFDALISERPYKHAISYNDAIKTLKQNSQGFDPLVLSSFLEISELEYNTIITMEKNELEMHLIGKLSNYFEV
ncbi:HD-GYP domain-containing protein [Desulfosarcina widdelii]|uniref:HD-GYP domain-containing protein n=1 Tax=Desulfosarcina widdelii TaxID=947919 RepID=UPI001478204C|nr:HD domain-containing phosphohydrolase [Desulfosarcina widdelii]